MSKVIQWARRLFVRRVAAEPSAITGPADPASGSDDVVQAFNASRGTVVASCVQWAGTSETRRRGLLGRTELRSDEGLYIVPTQWIHMFGMRFPIDVAFLSHDGRVLFVHHRLKPNRLSRLIWRADGALELSAGALQRSRTVPGDVIEFRPSPVVLQ